MLSMVAYIPALLSGGSAGDRGALGNVLPTITIEHVLAWIQHMISFICLFSMGYEIEKHDWPSFVRAIIMSVERY